MSYEQYFKLTEQPFSTAPDSRFFFDSKPHKEALLKILHAAETMKGLVIIIGDIGTGKTLLARRALEEMEKQEQFVESLLVMVHSEITPEWLLKRIAQQIGINKPADKKIELLPQLYERLMAINESGKKAVIVIDEANMLKSKDIFEEFRGLLNIEIPGKKLLTIILIGMPELEENIALDPAFQQRIAIKHYLTKLDKEETYNYIIHRMKIAGAQRDIFSDMALEAIYNYTGGTPRLINIVCDNALLEAFLLKRDKVDLSIVENVASDLNLRRQG
ncbi:MAG: AAA family ATPase [Candidatus Goldbacteria bacterium]|nr:AAA family ATPase [Candidatus Goldiibacteriota bacterium]